MEETSHLGMVLTTLVVIVAMALLSCLCCLGMRLRDLEMKRYILELANKKGVKVDLDKCNSRKPQTPDANENCTIIIPDVGIIL